jgi:hypothetical protein
MGPEVLPELSSDELMPLKLCKRLKCLHIHGQDVENLDFLDVSPLLMCVRERERERERESV